MSEVEQEVEEVEETETQPNTDRETQPTALATETDQAPQGYWPEDWLDHISKGDEKRGNILGRYTSPEALADALIAAQSRIRSGELLPVLGENPSDEELKAWREANGIPAEAKDYDLSFEDGLVVGEEDQAIVNGFLERAHEVHMKPEQVKEAVHWYYETVTAQQEARDAADDENRDETIADLSAEYGKDYTRYKNMVRGVLSQFPESVRESLESARFDDGRAIFNHPDVFRGFLALAMELNPAGVVPPAGSGDIQQTAKEELAEMREFIRKNRKAYNDDPEMQERFRNLLVQAGES